MVAQRSTQRELDCLGASVGMELQRSGKRSLTIEMTFLHHGVTGDGVCFFIAAICENSGIEQSCKRLGWAGDENKDTRWLMWRDRFWLCTEKTFRHDWPCRFDGILKMTDMDLGSVR